MSNRVKEMLTVRAIIQLMHRQVSLNRISKQLNIGRRTVRKYAKLARESSYSLDALLAMDDPTLSAIIYPQKEKMPDESDSRKNDFVSRLAYFAGELKRTGVTKYLLWKEYRTECPDGYSYSQLCQSLAKYFEVQKATMHFEHSPAAVMFIDFAGDKMHYTDRDTGQVIAVEILVCVLPFSGYSFVIALPNATLPQVLKGLNKCLAWLGGVPQNIKSDNMKQVVVKSSRYEPVFTEMIQQWAMYNCTGLLAARVRKPRDKPHVENEVKLTYQRIYAPLRDRVFFNIDEINVAIQERLVLHHAECFQQQSHNRQQLFEQQEKPLLSTLPVQPYQLKRKVRSKVGRDYHVILGEDWHHYSVPYQYIGKHLDVIYDTDYVEVYHLHERLAVHRRSYKRRGWTTLKEHMPNAHQKLTEQKGYNRGSFLTKAASYGPYTHEFIDGLFKTRAFTEQSYQSCLGIFRLGDLYGADRLEAACKRALAYGNYTWRIIHNILANNRDKEDIGTTQITLFQLPIHENLRGGEAYG